MEAGTSRRILATSGRRVTPKPPNYTRLDYSSRSLAEGWLSVDFGVRGRNRFLNRYRWPRSSNPYPSSVIYRLESIDNDSEFEVQSESEAMTA